MSPSLQDSPPNPSPETDNSRARFSSFAQIALGLAAVAYFIYAKPDSARTVAIFLVVLGVLVFVHEWGHFQFARWAGMKVNRFALGFPPFIFNREKNGVTYSIGALPIGGMVDIAGLGSEEEMVNTAKGEVAAPRRDTSRPFGQKQFQDGSLFWRFMVLFAGPLMNFLFAIVAFVGIYSTVGVPEPTAPVKIQSVVANAPAASAGLQKGDQILALDGQPARNPTFFSQKIREGGTQNRTFTVQRGAEKLNIKLSPALRDLNGTGTKVPSVGIAFAPTKIEGISYEKMSPMAAVGKGFADSIQITTSILDIIKRAFTRNLSKDEVEGIGGPVKIAQATGDASRFGLPVMIQFAAMLSVNLGLMNLLPLPALDGGRILFLGYELVARRPFNPKWEGLVHAAGMLMLLTFMLFITLRDVNAGALLERFTN
ncbi:MAG: RIP metalloprotease [Armatimonadetes bacterium]|nr:RIP metalloprotease [Armatimonadota bacterium]